MVTLMLGQSLMLRPSGSVLTSTFRPSTVTSFWLGWLVTLPSMWVHSTVASSVIQRITWTSCRLEVHGAAADLHGATGRLERQVDRAVEPDQAGGQLQQVAGRVLDPDQVVCQLDRAARGVLDPDLGAVVVEQQPVATGCLERVALDGATLDAAVV